MARPEGDEPLLLRKLGRGQKLTTKKNSESPNIGRRYKNLLSSSTQF